ncbi:hypothetical protein RMATCC62417_13475 [Rhizopus microsporus]|nr:hypothetical protein RMATCC62417_13475 [Rhizopus microsporus]
MSDSEPNNDSALFYQYLYLPSKYCRPVAEARSQLRALQLDTHRILDIHYLARGVLAIPIHRDYIVSTKQALAYERTDTPIRTPEDFEPLNPATPNDLLFAVFGRHFQIKQTSGAPPRSSPSHSRSYVL